MIPYSRQCVSAADVEAVSRVLESDFLTQGPMVPEFERRLAAYCGGAHAVVVSSATAALHVACLGLDLGPGDWLWTSPNSFVASANCARYCGAEVDFVDIDPATRNMCVQRLAHKLELAEREGRLPKIVIPVHFAGRSCDMRRIAELGQKYGFRIVEDASHAVGGNHAGERIGSCRYADICVFSFHAIKTMTTGEGGAMLTNDAELAARLARLRSHGVTRESQLLDEAGEGPWYYEQQELGYNYRMTDIQAALGTSQLGELDNFVAARRAQAGRYGPLLRGLPLQLPAPDPESESALHLYTVAIDCEGLGLSRREVFAQMRGAGIGVNVHYIPIHTQPYYRRLGFRRGDFPNAEEHYRTVLTLPLYPGLSVEDQAHVATTLAAALASGNRS